MSGSLAAVLADTADRSPDHTALVFGVERLTYRQLWLSARQYAGALAGHGVRPGDRVALLLPNSAIFPAVVLQRAGTGRGRWSCRCTPS